MVGQAIGECLKEKKSVRCSGIEIKDALLKAKYEGITGTTQFDQYGEPANKYYSVYTVENGQFKPLDFQLQVD